MVDGQITTHIPHRRGQMLISDKMLIGCAHTSLLFQPLNSESRDLISHPAYKILPSPQSSCVGKALESPWIVRNGQKGHIADYRYSCHLPMSSVEHSMKVSHYFALVF